MNEVIGARAPGWLRLVALLALLWNLIGVYFYLASVGMVPAPDPAMADQEMPAWVQGSFAICVFAGALGSLGLLLLKNWSKLLLLLSFVAIVAQDVYVFALRPGGATEIGMPLAVTLIGLLLVWLAYWASGKGWLN